MRSMVEGQAQPIPSPPYSAAPPVPLHQPSAGPPPPWGEE